jgi:hypothetical protein
MLLQQPLERGPGCCDPVALQRVKRCATFRPRPMRRKQ